MSSKIQKGKAQKHRREVEKSVKGKAKNQQQMKPAQTKKTKKNQKKSSDSESEDMSDVEVNFQLFNMAERDYHSVKQYLANAFGSTDHGVDLVNLTTFICEDLADQVGTCIKTEGEDSDPFGFVTGIPTSLLQTCQNGAFNSSQKTLTAFFSEKLGSEEFDVEHFFSEKGNIMLILERLINVPFDLAAPLLRQFLDDWKAASRDDPVNFSAPKQVFLMTPIYREIESKLDRELGLVEGKRGFQTAAKEACFYYPEAEFLERFFSHSWTFSVNTGHETSDSKRAFGDAGIEPGRRAFLLSWAKFVEFVSSLEQESSF